MHVPCAGCRKYLNVTEEYSGKKVKCPNCNFEFIIPMFSESTVQDSQWKVMIESDQEYGPISQLQLNEWVSEGRVGCADQILKIGWTQWKWATEVFPELEVVNSENELQISTNNNSFKRDLQTNVGNNNQDVNFTLGISGSIALFVGLFCPVINVPFIGGLSCFKMACLGLQNSLNELSCMTIFSFISVMVSFVATFNRKFCWLWVTVGVIVAMMFSIFFRLFQAKSVSTNEMSGAIIDAMRIDFGIAVLIVGVGLLVAAATLKGKKQGRNINVRR